MMKVREARELYVEAHSFIKEILSLPPLRLCGLLVLAPKFTAEKQRDAESFHS